MVKKRSDKIRDIEEEFDEELDEELKDEFDEEEHNKHEKHVKIGKTILKIFFIIILLFILSFMYMHYIGTAGLVVKEYKVSSKRLPDNFHGLKIVHFSDLHYKNTINKKELKRLVNKINEIKPDIVVFTGDLLSNNKEITKNDIKTLTKELNRIEASIGIYSIKGDEDYNKTYDKVISKTNIKVINNSYEVIYNKGNIPILITGTGSILKNDCDLGSTYSYNEMDNLYTISLIHEADITEDIKGTYKPNLILAGHSNNGQIRLPLIGGMIKFEEGKKYVNPKYEFSNSTLFVSGGLGTSKYEFRLFNHPSINFYRLVKETN